MPYHRSEAIRAYHPSDLAALYRICLLTGDSGTDATHLYRDPQLLGHYYVAPYVTFEPDLCFVLVQQAEVQGYVLGTRNSTAFADRCAREWFPMLQARYPLPAAGDGSPGARLIREFYREPISDPVWNGYPAHLHIDLLPTAQGQGWGRGLMEKFLAQLRAVDVAGVHLGVATTNQGAVAFYARMGFSRLEAREGAIIMGLRLT